MAKAKYKLKEILSSDFDLPGNYDDLVKVYRTVAKSADQRLVRLERYSEQDNFKVAKQWSYARAQRDIEAWSGEGATRFNTKPPDSVTSLKAKIEDIKTFLESPTSTKQGIKSIHQKRADTLNKKYGTNFTWDQVGTFFESKLSQDMDKKMGSGTKIRVIAQIQKSKKQVVKSIEEANARDLRVPDNMVGELVKDTVTEYGQEVMEALFKK